MWFFFLILKNCKDYYKRVVIFLVFIDGRKMYMDKKLVGIDKGFFKGMCILLIIIVLYIFKEF